ncbi:hypothetical protein P378_14065 [Desulforamulus profundi]|uniref:DUF2007 domain-containing protein n=2 Tax=Desulforamulus profundi TaxID=1383067 RepID=A0A2C6MCJ9_9FIRM|nr:hypothetical protein P378_14065 [Desulforamulus profundi]
MSKVNFSLYSTQDPQKYASAKGKLMNHNIPVKTEIINPNRSSFGRGGHDPFGSQSRFITYNILVKKEDIHRANEVIHHR